ncbi:hypothetical protein K504DRAFT_514524 [Pleomassaria siparia CBS 279.74]|uniref:Gamma-glutamylcyclotransferase AIG2-like domain-containing protein n=1 Tax=Pleomassaria siparia CBS 279.74 TaxID=1314801 RepID=A0A6G1K0B5_9PLEO|nr:hypothetical protein K504DRAFT_514524 [Pleomassaria siparia CBS 279.74]
MTASSTTNIGTMIDKPKKRIHPEDLRLCSAALNHRWSKRELPHVIAPDVPIFVCCTLMLPWVLARVLGLHSIEGALETTKYMTRATLLHHVRSMIKFVERPTMVYTEKDIAVDGILVAGLQFEAYAKMEEYIGLEQHSKEIVQVEIETLDGGQATVAAYGYIWNQSPSFLTSERWTLVDLMRNSTYKLGQESTSMMDP